MKKGIFDALAKLAKKDRSPEPRSAKPKKRKHGGSRPGKRQPPWSAEMRRKRTLQLPPAGRAQLDRIVSKMEPGCWYSAGDLCERPGVRMFSHGYLSRRLNPEWTPTWRRSWTEQEALPKYLYSLTPAGVARSRLLRLLG